MIPSSACSACSAAGDGTRARESRRLVAVGQPCHKVRCDRLAPAHCLPFRRHPSGDPLIDPRQFGATTAFGRRARATVSRATRERRCRVWLIKHRGGSADFSASTGTRSRSCASKRSHTLSRVAGPASPSRPSTRSRRWWPCSGLRPRSGSRGHSRAASCVPAREGDRVLDGRRDRRLVDPSPVTCRSATWRGSCAPISIA